MLWVGTSKVSRFVSAGLRVPFGGGNYGLLQYMIDDHWTPETAETAKTPRFPELQMLIIIRVTLLFG